MHGSLPKSLLDWSSWAWSSAADSSNPGRVLFIGECALVHAPTDATQLAAPTSMSELQDSLRESESFDSALISAWSPEVDLPKLVESVRRSVRPGGTVALVAPVAQDGWRRVRGGVLGVLRRRRPTPLEELCGALLLARLVDPRVRILSDATDYRVAWATVPSGLEKFDLAPPMLELVS